MYKFKDKNLATYVQHNCKLYDSKSKNFVLVSNLHCSNALHFFFTAHLSIRQTYIQLPRL